MKTVIATACVAASIALAAVSLTSVASGTATRSTDPQVAALKKRVTKLETSVKALQKTQKLLITVAVANFAGIACTNAITADAFQSTWGVIDQISTATQAGKVYFGPQAPLNDQRSCTDLAIHRAANPSGLPSLAPSTALINFFYGP
jgi:hypothetical protein